MSEKKFVLSVEVSCKENLGEMYAGMTLPMALVRPSNEMVLCEAHFPAAEGLNKRDAIIDGLAPYFNARFRRDRVTGIDHLEQLADDLLAFNYKPKDFARVANLLYNSKSMINKPASYRAWYADFCRIVGCRHIGSYHQGHVDDFRRFERQLPYVEL